MSRVCRAALERCARARAIRPCRTRLSCDDTIYKICDRALWREAERTGVFTGAPVDHADGFIHFSTAAQVAETAARHFAGKADLLLVAVDAAALGPALRYEPSRGGALFPHLYGDAAALGGALGQAAAARPRRTHVFPELEP